MSRVYFTRCDGCNRLSDLCITPVVPGWQSLSDNTYGTNTIFDICPECQESMGLRSILKSRIRARAIYELRDKISTPTDQIAPGLTVEQLEERINSGEFDKEFGLGDGIDIEQLAIEEAELVE